MSIPLNLDPDKRRRISGMIYDPTPLYATSVNGLVMSLYIDSDDKFVTTKDTTLPYHRTDGGNTPVDILVYIRKAAMTDIPLVETNFFEGGYSYDREPVRSLKTAVQLIPKNQIYNPTTKRGINGWKLAKISYRAENKTSDDLYAGVNPPLVSVDLAEPVYQMAVCLDTNDAGATITSHIHFDLIEV